MGNSSSNTLMYVISQNFSNGFDQGQFHYEITQNAVLSTTFEGLNVAGDILSVVFTEAVTNTQVEHVELLIRNHVPDSGSPGSSDQSNSKLYSIYLPTQISPYNSTSYEKVTHFIFPSTIISNVLKIFVNSYINYSVTSIGLLSRSGININDISSSSDSSSDSDSDSGPVVTPTNFYSIKLYDCTNRKEIAKIENLKNTRHHTYYFDSFQDIPTSDAVICIELKVNHSGASAIINQVGFIYN